MADNQHPPINWRSRIVKYGKIAASQITPHPDNPRKHPQVQREAVAASFDELGQIAPILININNGYLVDGEERSWLALGQGDDVEVDAIWVDLSEEEHSKALVYFDATGDLATYDAERLNRLLEEVNSDSSAIQQMIAELAVSAKLPLPNDPYAEWQGMPEFEQEDLEAYQTIHVHFASATDVQAFSKLVAQSLSEKTRSIWYPQAEIGRYSDKRYTDEP